MGVKMHFDFRNLNGTVLLQSLTTSCWLYTWEQTNSSNKFAANLNMKGISFFLLTLYMQGVPKKRKLLKIIYC